MWLILLFAVWIIILEILRRGGLYFFRFLLGSAGLFCLLIYFGGDTIEVLLLEIVIFILDSTDGFFAFYNVFPEADMINVFYGSTSIVTFYIDYECTGIIEMLVFISLIMFYPIYSRPARVYKLIKGVILIMAANIVRVLFILTAFHFFGSDYFFLIHAVIGRIVFFSLVLLIYFNVFTKAHILKQRIGGLA